MVPGTDNQIRRDMENVSMKIRYKLWREDKDVCLQVLKQDPSTHGNGLLHRVGDVTLWSEKSPELRVNRVFVRGIRHISAEKVATINFRTRNEAEEYMEKVRTLIDGYNGVEQEDEPLDIDVSTPPGSLDIDQCPTGPAEMFARSRRILKECLVEGKPVRTEDVRAYNFFADLVARSAEAYGVDNLRSYRW